MRKKKVVILVLIATVIIGYIIADKHPVEKSFCKQVSNRKLRLGNMIQVWMNELGPPDSECTIVAAGFYCWKEEGIIALTHYLYKDQKLFEDDKSKWRVSSVIIPMKKRFITPVFSTNL